MKLTEDQSKLVEDNHNLIYWYCHSNKISVEDYYDLLAIELCYTAMKYNYEKGSFANYFKLRADGAIYKEYMKKLSQKRNSIAVEYVENVHSIEDQDDIALWAEIKELMSVENGEILKLRYEGYSQTEIAKQLGVSQSYISNIIKKMRDQYYEPY